MPQAQLNNFFKPKEPKKRKSAVAEEEPIRKISREGPDADDKERANREKLEGLFPGLKHMHYSWMKALLPTMESKSFGNLSKFVANRRSKTKVFPAQDNVFKWAERDLKETKVVILGQDPYHGPNQAHGLSFSVLKPTRTPPSLLNMYKELEQDENVEFSRPNHGDLTKWAEQGVLLLNAVLTVDQASANSHQKIGWEKLTDAAIKVISQKTEHTVFLLWGSNAQKKDAIIDKKKHSVLKQVHPSPLSAFRGFFGCRHFSKANQYLKEHGKAEINWNALNE